jgi:hypothetical protein
MYKNLMVVATQHIIPSEEAGLVVTDFVATGNPGLTGIVEYYFSSVADKLERTKLWFRYDDGCTTRHMTLGTTIDDLGLDVVRDGDDFYLTVRDELAIGS